MVTPQGAIRPYHMGGSGPLEDGAVRSDVEGVTILVFGRTESGDRVWGDFVWWGRERVVRLTAFTDGMMLKRLWEWVWTGTPPTPTVPMGWGTGGEVS